MYLTHITRIISVTNHYFNNSIFSFVEAHKSSIISSAELSILNIHSKLEVGPFHKAFKEYPIQLCHFHQRKTINKYLTRKPKLDIAIDLQKIMRNLITDVTIKRISNFTKGNISKFQKYFNFRRPLILQLFHKQPLEPQYIFFP